MLKMTCANSSVSRSLVRMLFTIRYYKHFGVLSEIFFYFILSWSEFNYFFLVLTFLVDQIHSSSKFPFQYFILVMAPITISSVTGSMALDHRLPKGPCKWNQYHAHLGKQSYRSFCGSNSNIPYSMGAAAKSPVVLLSGPAVSERYSRSPHAIIHSFLRKLKHSFREFFSCFCGKLIVFTKCYSKTTQLQIKE